jgi:hypothetical protein
MFHWTRFLKPTIELWDAELKGLPIEIVHRIVPEHMRK